LNRAWLPWIEAVLRKDQRRFHGALKRIHEALALDPGDLKAEILLTTSRIHSALGDWGSSTATLREAAPLIDPIRDSRNAFGLRFNLLVDLCHLGRAAEAEPLGPELRILAERLGEELDLTRVLWLEAKVAAGLGHFMEARAAFEQAQKVFRQRDLSFNYALVSLELGVLFLEKGHTSEARRLAGEILQVFRTQDIQREALAAIQLFCQAAQKETATVGLTRHLVRFLSRAQYDPGLKLADVSPEPEHD
jgi:tetratricopeptide (TPR) repeat protein